MTNPHTTTGNGADDIVHTLESAAESAGRYARKAFDQSADSTDALTIAIREEPVKAALIALGIGVLIGAVLRR
ncbi:MAG: hypothetical protein WCD70_13620 [Alphaproteobacteria bacterium]